MRLFILLMAILPFLGGLTPLPALAQEAVKIRTGVHEDYSRLVFEWPSQTSYSLSKDGNRVLLRFGKAGKPDLSGVGDNAKNILKVETISTGREPLQMAVTIPDGSRFRDFPVDDKVIIDVYNPPAPPKKAVEKKASPAPAIGAEPKQDKAPPKTAPSKAAVQGATPAPVEKSMPAAKPAPEAKAEAEPAQSAPAPVPAAEKPAPQPTPAIDSHVVTLTTTSSLGMASFIRSGYLWVVVDNPDLTVEPQLAGPQKSRFSAFEKIPVEGGAAYRLDLPSGLHAYGEGGGLSWRIVLSPTVREVSPANVIRQDRTLVWPLKEMRREIVLTDPDVGDKITVVTAAQADQFANGRKEFVELTQLDGVIGLAFAAKSDDIDAEITAADVKVRAPGGLVLAGAMDARMQEIHAAVEATGKNDQTPEEAPAGNNAYHFTNWEMGGVTALNDNMNALMIEAANKDEAGRTEDVLTMAKINLANHRGAEALGLLRIASGFVPDLENNAEFKALRGAAAALAGKYDLAFSDYTNTNVQKYDDVKYWRAYTLAGLEDWEQAIEAMPSDFDLIATYPAPIRAPLSLSFAEIALRAGKVPQAEGILGMLEPSLETMPLPYRAAWNYLMGEAQRQRGNFAKAQEYWKPLVEGGKDYLYRAKAGLSLTRLQMTQKQLKPAEAIDRLEGLRYAWRGDELETLINYRLGRVYVENSDFLKGLTVLRNAVSLSPGTELSREITDYMTKTFRDVFANDRLKDVSPLEAISLYEEFKELTPAGEEGDRFVEKLAERLVQSDLLGRAASLLEYQVNHRLQGDKKAEIAIRLAAIRLLDGNPDGALRSLEIAQAVLNGAAPAAGDVPAEGEAPTPTKPLTSDSEKQRQIDLLKARALSMKNKTDEAMVILEKMRLDPDVNRLRADIAWSAGRWEDAAIALNDLMLAENISPRSPLSPYHTDLIMNRAIALNLSNNRVALSNLRQRYKDQMDKTEKGKLFDVVSRPRRPDMIGSRESIERMISEISLFQGFLDSYSKMVSDDKTTAPAPAGPSGASAAPKEEADAAEESAAANGNGGTAEVPAAQ